MNSLSLQKTFPARYAQAQADGVCCGLCPHQCFIQPGRRGICGVRENRDGQLVSLVYGRLVATQTDPIEKKPLFHVLPGSSSYSIATLGCNFHCLNCQNFRLSQSQELSPAQLLAIPEVTAENVVQAARQQKASTISYTFVEPTIFFEFAYDCCLLAKESGLGNIWVSNGYISKTALNDLAPLLLAANIDIKSFRDAFYQQVCKARLQPVLDTVCRLKEKGVWLEITTLLIPGLNDSPKELSDIARFISSVDNSIPWHVSGFFPTYRMLDRPSTPPESLSRAREIGFEAGLKYVYEGNRPENRGEDTRCPSCRTTVMRRNRYQILANLLIAGSCPVCGQLLAGRWR